MGKRKTTTEVPLVLRRSKRRINQQKSIPIESLLNSDSEVASRTQNNSTYYIQESSNIATNKPNTSIIDAADTNDNSATANTSVTTLSATSTIAPTDSASSPTTDVLTPTTTPIPKLRLYANKKDASISKKASTTKKSRGTTTARKVKATSEEVIETQIANHQLPKSPKIEYDHEALRSLLQDQTSYLATAELKTMIPELLSGLPQQDLDELAQLLPYTDKEADGSFSLNFASASNNFFWEATAKWQDVLYLGGFDEKKMANKRRKGKTQEDTSFKDENYENYWGERLKRDRAMKEQPSKKKRK